MSAVLAAPRSAAAPDQKRRPGTTSQSVFPGGPYFLVGCGASHRSNDDPIVFPRQGGRSHNHTFIGNRSTNADSTPASLRETATRCDHAADTSAYWVPTLYEDRQPVGPLVALVYYVKRTSGSVRPQPAGLKVIAGNPDARRPQSLRIASWGCGFVGGGQRYGTVPGCSENQPLNLRIEFPNCWDGRNLDSPDHKRHMTYSSRGRCPSTHPVELTALLLVVVYPANGVGAVPSSGRFSAHADFINAWDQDVLTRFTERLN